LDVGGEGEESEVVSPAGMVELVLSGVSETKNLQYTINNFEEYFASKDNMSWYMFANRVK
jgi:hypothetical protein